MTRGNATVTLLIVVVSLIGFYLLFGFYSIQPIGALPEGRTLVVWRASGEPFFNSPDAICLDRMGYVSLMCRGMAMGQGPIHRIVAIILYAMGLFYQRWGQKLRLNFGEKSPDLDPKPRSTPDSTPELHKQ